jgi:hypothetical protein
MSSSLPPLPTHRLSYGSLLIGRITDVFVHQGTWFGRFEIALDPTADALARRFVDFIEFCRNWHERLDKPPTQQPDADEFDAYSDVIESGLWTVESAGGEIHQVEHAPVFSGVEDVSWIVKE